MKTVRPHKPYKQQDSKLFKYNRFSWLRGHPEDISIDLQNIKARKRGYANDDVRQLMAAICLQACVDYKQATSGKKIEGEKIEETIERCEAFFADEDDIFQMFVNRISPEEIKHIIKATPKGSIRSIWKNNEFSETPAIFTTPIIEE